MFIEGLPRHLRESDIKQNLEQTAKTNNQLSHLLEQRNRMFLNRYHPDALVVFVRDFLPDEDHPTVGSIYIVSHRVFQTLETAIEDSAKPH